MLLLEVAVRAPREFDQFLGPVGIADRNDQPSADLELLLQCGRNPRPAGGDQDGIELVAIRPAQCAVAMSEFDVLNSEFAEAFVGLRDERRVSLNGTNFPGDL